MGSPSEDIDIGIMEILGVHQIVQFPEPSKEPAENDARSTSGLARPDPSCSTPTLKGQLTTARSHLSLVASVHVAILKAGLARRQLSCLL